MPLCQFPISPTLNHSSLSRRNITCGIALKPSAMITPFRETEKPTYLLNHLCFLRVPRISRLIGCNKISFNAYKVDERVNLLLTCYVI